MARRLLELPALSRVSEVAMVLDEGQILDGKYVIVRILATGSMGEVYLGRNERIGKEVAVKVLRREFADDRAIVNRFEQEARIGTAVKSSHVVDVYDLGELPSGERFIVMEYVDGESLGMRMARESKMSAHALGPIILQILDGLVAAHAAGVIHRDLKPENVILTQRDGHETVKLVDFGISKLSTPGRPDLKRATLEGMFLGTPIYMSPEQACGEPDGIDHRTDIFSLGVSIYEALSGEVPFNADNVVSLLNRVMTEPEIPVEQHVPHVDPGLARIVKKAMAKDPDDRYQTAVEMREAVASWYSIFGSTSAMRSSLEGMTRAPSAPPSADDTAPIVLPYVGIAIDRKRTRVALAAAAIAAAFTATIARHSDSAAPPHVTATVQAAPDPLVVPTTPATTYAPLPPEPAPAHEVQAPAVVKPNVAPPVIKAAIVAPRTRAKQAQKHDDPAPPTPARDAGAASPKNEEVAIPMPMAETPLPDPPSIP